MNIIATPLESFLIIETDVYRDERGFFLETYHQDRYIQSGITVNICSCRAIRLQNVVSYVAEYTKKNRFPKQITKTLLKLKT